MARQICRINSYFTTYRQHVHKLAALEAKYMYCGVLRPSFYCCLDVRLDQGLVLCTYALRIWTAAAAFRRIPKWAIQAPGHRYIIRM